MEGSARKIRMGKYQITIELEVLSKCSCSIISTGASNFEMDGAGAKKNQLKDFITPFELASCSCSFWKF